MIIRINLQHRAVLFLKMLISSIFFENAEGWLGRFLLKTKLQVGESVDNFGGLLLIPETRHSETI